MEETTHGDEDRIDLDHPDKTAKLAHVPEAYGADKRRTALASTAASTRPSPTWPSTSASTTALDLGRRPRQTDDQFCQAPAIGAASDLEKERKEKDLGWIVAVALSTL